MAEKTATTVARREPREPFDLLRRFAEDWDRFFEPGFVGAFRWPRMPKPAFAERPEWAPNVDVFERDNRLITRVDLPGVKREDLTVEVDNGYLAIYGERKAETDHTKDNVYRWERSYGSFYRAVPLPEGARAEDVKATFGDGVLEVSLPLAAKAEAKPRSVAIEEPGKTAAKAAA